MVIVRIKNVLNKMIKELNEKGVAQYSRIEMRICNWNSSLINNIPLSHNL